MDIKKIIIGAAFSAAPELKLEHSASEKASTMLADFVFFMDTKSWQEFLRTLANELGIEFPSSWTWSDLQVHLMGKCDELE